MKQVEVIGGAERINFKGEPKAKMENRIRKETKT